MIRIAIEVVIAILTLIGITFGAFFVLEERHANRAELEAVKAETETLRLERLELELNIKGDEIKRDVKRDAVARDHYRKIKLTRKLEPVEEDRMEYLEEQMIEKAAEHGQIMDQKAEVKMKLEGVK